MPSEKKIHTIISGYLYEETFIDQFNHIHHNQPGGGLLYAASGHALFNKNIGLIGKTSLDFLSKFWSDLEKLGADLRGITITSNCQSDQHYYRITSRDSWETTLLLRHFAELGYTIPKDLLENSSTYKVAAQKSIQNSSPFTSSDFPTIYREAKTVLLTSLDYLSHFACIPFLRKTGIEHICLRTSPTYMIPTKLSALGKLFHGIDIVFTTENEIKKVFSTHFEHYSEMLKALLTFEPSAFLINNKEGNYTCLCKEDHQILRVPHYPVNSVYPVGEYDCFCGAFTACQSCFNISLEECAAFASAAASVCSEGDGIGYILQTLPDIIRRRADVIRQNITYEQISSSIE